METLSQNEYSSPLLFPAAEPGHNNPRPLSVCFTRWRKAAQKWPSPGTQPPQRDSAAQQITDHSLTRTIKVALALVYVRVLDHVVVSRDKSLSMAEICLH